MKYQNSSGKIDTATKILKVDHAGEFGAVNIYRSQLVISRLLRRDYAPLLKTFLEDEKRHLQIFWVEIQRRNGIKCKSYWLCGVGGCLMGLFSTMLGKKGIMACTWAVESVVTRHLENQLTYLKNAGDREAYNTVNAIIKDEVHHRDLGLAEGGKNRYVAPLRFFIRIFTEMVIRFGMR